MNYTMNRTEDVAGLQERMESPDGCAGYYLRDVWGRRIARVKWLFLNRRGEPEYIRARMGRFGLGRLVLIPVAALRVDDASRSVTLE